MSAGLLAGRTCASHVACPSGVHAPRVCPATHAWPYRQPVQPLAALRPGASCWPACARGAPRGAPGAGARGSAGLTAAAVAEAERPLDSEAWREASWPDAFDRHFARGDLLGRGSFGTVYRCVERATGDEEFAVKVISKTRDGVDPARILMRIREEVDTLQRLQTRPETIRLRGVYEDAGHVYIVTELCMGGDLEQLLEARGTLSEADAARVAHDVLQVLQECHRQGILYADIKPSNFLLKQPAGTQPQLEVRVVDFGCSQRIQASAKLHKRTGTPLYMAPELFMRYYGVESDMWALGMLLYQLLSGTLPFWDEGESQSPFTVMTAILGGEVSFEGPVWDAISPHGKDLVRRLLDRDYNSRLNAADALDHPWIAEQCGEDAGCDVSDNVLDLSQLRRRVRGPEHAHVPSIILPD